MGRRSSRVLLPLLTAAASLLVAACDDTGTNEPSGDTANLSVYLTDAPGDVEAVWVEILQVYLQSHESGSTQLLDEPTELILLTDLVGSTQLLVADAELNAATYNQLRMVVGDAILLSSEGTVYVKGDPEIPAELADLPTGDLQCPSCSQSGLKITIPNDEMELEEGDASLVVDFDVAQSFGHKAGNSGKWIMHPVIHGTLVDEASAAPSIQGSVALGVDAQSNPVVIPECPQGSARSVQDFIPTATAQTLLDGNGDPILRTGQVKANGTYAITFVAPDTYAMGYVGQLDLETHVLTFTASVAQEQVTIADAGVQGVNYTIQSAVCAAK